MATKDFKASQIRTSTIIVSGSASDKPALLIYSASDATDFAGGYPAAMLSDVGPEVFLFVSGAVGKEGHAAVGGAKRRTGVVLFGGDVVISGTMYAENMVAEVNMNTTGSTSISGSLFLSGGMEIHGHKDVPRGFGGAPLRAAIHLQGGPGAGTNLESAIVWDDANAAVYETGNDLYVSASDDVHILGDVNFSDDAHFDSDGAKISFGTDSEVTLTHVHDTGLLLTDDSGVGTTKLMFGDSATFVQQQGDGELGIDADSVINITAPTVDIDASTEVNVSGQATIAGTLLVAEDIQHNGDTDTKVTFETDSITLTAGGVEFLRASEGSNDVLTLNRGNADVDMDIEGATGRFAMAFDAGDHSIAFLSGTAAETTSLDEMAGSDVAFFVSGAVKNRALGRGRGTALFGGDIVASGSAFFSVAQNPDSTADPLAGAGKDVNFFSSGSVSGKNASEPRIALFGGDVVTSGSLYVQNSGGTSQPQVSVIQQNTAAGYAGAAVVDFMAGYKNNYTDTTDADSGLGAKFTITKYGPNNTVALGGADHLALWNQSGSVAIRVGNATNPLAEYVGTQTIVLGDSHATAYFRGVGSKILGSGAVAILSGGVGTDPNQADALDSNFMVSGAIGSRGTARRGTSVFGGDVYVSGALYADDFTVVDDFTLGDNLSLTSDAAVVAFGVDGEVTLTHVHDAGLLLSDDSGIGTTQLQFGDSGTFIAQASNGNLEIEADTSLIVDTPVVDLEDDGVILKFGADAEVTLTHVHDTGLLLSDASGVGTTKLMFGDDATFIQQQSDGELGIDADSIINITAPTVDIDASTEVNISGQLSVAGPTIINEAGADVDFRLETNNRTHALYIDGGTDQVFILSGSTSDALSANEAGYADVAFFVSGAIGSAFQPDASPPSVANPGVKGVALFGGDVVVSGSLHILAGDSLYVSGTKIATVNEGTLLQLSGGAGTDPDPANAVDSNFFISGAIGSRGTAVKGTAVFGGDLVVSGNAHVLGSITLPDDLSVTDDAYIRGDSYVTGTLYVADKLEHGGDSNTFISFHAVDSAKIVAGGSAIIGYTDSESTISINSDEAARNTLIKTENAIAFIAKTATDQVLILSGGGGKSDDQAAGVDVNFFVSGTVGSRATAVRGTSVFGGDLVVSGNLTDGSGNPIAGGGSSGSFLEPSAGYLVQTGSVSLAGNKGFGHDTSDQSEDAFFFVSGALGSLGTDRRAGSIFGGDLHVSGVIKTGGENFHALLGSYVGGTISGSIHQTSGGLSYLVAGNNTTITSGANGQVTIADSNLKWTRNSAGRVYLTDTDDKLHIGGTGDPGGKVEIHVSDTENIDGLLIDFNETGGKTALEVDSESTSGMTIKAQGFKALYAKQDISNGYAAYFTRNINESGNEPLVGILDDNTSNTQPALQIRQDGTGPILRLRDGANIVHEFKDGGQVFFNESSYGPDVIFHVSGAINSHGTALRGASDFGGDVVVSGSTYLGLGSGAIISMMSGGAASSADEGGYLDTNFFVSGSSGSKNSSIKGTAVFGGDLHISGNFTVDGSSGASGITFNGGNGSNNQVTTSDGAGKIVAESNMTFDGSTLTVTGDLVPGADASHDLGASDARWANIYTGDLHLQNERGHWQIIEEADCLTVTNKLTGKRYKMVLEPYEEDSA